MYDVESYRIAGGKVIKAPAWGDYVNKINGIGSI